MKVRKHSIFIFQILIWEVEFLFDDTFCSRFVLGSGLRDHSWSWKLYVVLGTKLNWNRLPARNATEYLYYLTLIFLK